VPTARSPHDPQSPVLQSPYATAGRLALQSRAREFARDRVLPVADQLDPQRAEMPVDLVEDKAALGWFGITVPVEQGGLGLGVLEYCLVSEELARAWLSVGSILARGQGLGTQVLDAGRRAELLGRSARGEWIGAIALSEPTAGSDLAGVRTRAVRDGDDWLLTGHKRWAGNALAADFVEVLARVGDPGQGESRSAGLVPFLVVKERATFPVGMTGQAAMVKLLASEMAVAVTGQAMQLHGGNGYTTERRVERYWRDARLTTIFEGTSEIQRRIISDRMLPRERRRA
jgi:alkylation response protein AidB-like acyl-CoA dehydrogenase